MAEDIASILARFVMTPGNRLFTGIFPLTRETQLEHQITAASKVISEIRRPGVRVFVDGDEVYREHQAALPTIVVTVSYPRYLSDTEVVDHLRQTLARIAARLGTNEVIDASIQEPNVEVLR